MKRIFITKHLDKSGFDELVKLEELLFSQFNNIFNIINSRYNTFLCF